MEFRRIPRPFCLVPQIVVHDHPCWPRPRMVRGAGTLSSFSRRAMPFGLIPPAYNRKIFSTTAASSGTMTRRYLRNGTQDREPLVASGSLEDVQQIVLGGRKRDDTSRNGDYPLREVDPEVSEGKDGLVGRR